jgi:hypothetical protein
MEAFQKEEGGVDRWRKCLCKSVSFFVHNAAFRLALLPKPVTRSFLFKKGKKNYTVLIIL